LRIKQNAGPADRLARIIGGTAVAVMSRQPLLKFLGAFLVLEGITGYCLWYDIMNINTLAEKKEGQENKEGADTEEDFPMPADVLRFRNRAVQ